MLPLRLLDLDVQGGAVRPRFLGRDDERWIGAVLGVLEDLAGRPAGAADEAFRGAVLGIGRAFGVSPRALALLFRLERGRFTSRIDAPAPPAQIRDVLFELAASLPRREAIREAALRLGVDAEAMERALFADRAGARVLVPPGAPSTPPAAVLRYNHALSGALLERASHVSATVAGDVRFVAGRAKRAGLVATFAEGDGVVHVGLSGPLSLFHATTKYGRALARFVPILVATRAWSLTAKVVLDGTTLQLDLDATAPLGDAPAPRPPPFTLARQIERELARAGSSWRTAPSNEVIRAGGRVFFPDLALEGPRGRVLVEVLPEAALDVLAETERALASADVPVIVIVKGATDACAIASAADRALASSRRRAS